MSRNWADTVEEEDAADAAEAAAEPESPQPSPSADFDPDSSDSAPEHLAPPYERMLAEEEEEERREEDQEVEAGGVVTSDPYQAAPGFPRARTRGGKRAERKKRALEIAGVVPPGTAKPWARDDQGQCYFIHSQKPSAQGRGKGKPIEKGKGKGKGKDKAPGAPSTGAPRVPAQSAASGKPSQKGKASDDVDINELIPEGRSHGGTPAHEVIFVSVNRACLKTGSLPQGSIQLLSTP